MQNLEPIYVLPGSDYDNTKCIAQELRQDHPVSHISEPSPRLQGIREPTLSLAKPTSL